MTKGELKTLVMAILTGSDWITAAIYTASRLPQSEATEKTLVKRAEEIMMAAGYQGGT